MVMWHTVKFSDINSMPEKNSDERHRSLTDLDQENHNAEDKKAAEAEQDGDEREPEPFKFEDIVPRPPPDNAPPPPMSLQSQIKELNLTFCKQTTAHGWGRVGRAPNKYVRSLWVVLSIMALAVNIMHVVILVKHYTKFQCEIKIDFITADTEFPAITLCNILPWSMAAAAQFLQNPNTSTYQWHQLTSNLSKFDKFAELLNRTGEFDWVKNRMQQPQSYFENIGWEAILLGHSRKNLILSCTFDTQPCNESNFMFYPTPNFFNCYTFQTFEDWGRTTGPNAGLSMILYLEAYDKSLSLDATYFTLSNIGNAAGVRVNIHAPNTRPSPIDQGFDIPPGYSANIGLNVNQYARLGQPWGVCVEDVVKEDYNLEDRFVYTPHDCVRSCQQVYIMEQCNCISSSLPLPNFNITNLNYCGAWNVSTIQDLDLYLDKIMCESKEMSFFMENLTTLCDCYPACRNIEHTMDVSYSFWPNQYSQPDFFKVAVLDHPDSTELQAYQHLAKYNTSDLVESEMITSNFARINVFRKSMMVKQHEEKPSYDIPQLASDLGGTFGLWIGMSLISWCEVIELIIKMFISICHSARKNLMIGDS